LFKREIENMRIEKREKKVYEEIYIADDGTQFDTKRHCLEYEKEIEMCKKAKDAEKLRIRELDDVIPLIDVEIYENREYVWYKLENEKDFNTLKEAFEYSKDFTVPDGYPTLYCVESFGYDNIYEDDNTWTCTLNECKDAAVEFWERFGYKLTF
jgi:hypothetical protein